ncbi:dipeptidase [Pseudoduganella plicata]|uniref:Dipeptidase n=1 Tax=Pseudoduganella plicata TaxID=321984 RepID=A0A4P7BJJ3_9BURK|nr:dipeptidase [Pseudoduganella plicata]QBQ38610.1 dipeptidase [Pseudoduganella plicata]GGY83567.1 dipeptidase [Pseudoduganella plicata]
MLKKSVLLAASIAAALARPDAHAAPSAVAVDTARHARAAYAGKVVDTLAAMVSFNTVADPKVPFERNPAHLGFKQLLKDEAARLGFDYTDAGYVVVIGHGSGAERVGVITHGDVQPVDPSKWRQSPFKLDRTSEPGLLLGRGTEDDKGPIATALYAMKAIKDRKVPLTKRIELYVYMAEESDWEPLEAYLKTHTPPQINITLDAEYPAVTAEKGWGLVSVTIPSAPPGSAAVPGAALQEGPTLASYTGGFFDSQIPEDATAIIDGATSALEASIRARAAAQKGMRYGFERAGQRLTIRAKGVSAHSSKPEDGVNAIALLADALAVQPWRGTPAAAMVNFVNELVGTGLYGEKFGQVAYRDAFMGPMTVAPVVLKETGNGLQLNINLRRPRGKSAAQLEGQLAAAFDAWKAKQGGSATGAQLTAQLGEPWVRDDAPQLPVLLDVFSHYTGIGNARPVAIGGGTNSRLFPNAVSFGPGMPGAVYTGHSEHEFISEKQLLLNLEMYTAVLVELAR